MRYLGLDFGAKTIGVAVSDPENRLALGLETLRRKKEADLKANVHRIGDIIKEYGIGCIVMGYPLNLDGSVSERCKKTELFKERLERTFKRVRFELQDERLTSVQAERAMLETGVGSKERKNVIDEKAAVIILQTFLERQIAREQ